MQIQTRKKTSMMYKGILCMISLCTLWGCKDAKTSYASMSKEELQQVYDTNEQDVSNMNKDIETKKMTLSQYKKDKKRLTSLQEDIKKAQEEMLDIQKQALYVGKFVCKVNTCQGNPKHENYGDFIAITDTLVEARENLLQLQNEEEKLEDKIEQEEDIEEVIKEIETKIEKLTLENEEIKEQLGQ
ncbi:hypothetical protein ACWG0P_15185 [Amedibacillus sp. YH-ame6]